MHLFFITIINPIRQHETIGDRCSYMLPVTPTLTFCVFCRFQMNISLEDMDSSAENNSIVHLDAPILPDRADISNMTIIRTSNGSIIEDQMFLNTLAAQALSGIFVWSALLITCHQVSLSYFTQVPDRNISKYPRSERLKSLHQ